MKLITRKQAISEGKKWYFTGKPCLRGHLSVRKVSSASCYECDKGRIYIYTAQNAETPRQKALANGDKYYMTGEPCSRGHISKRQTDNRRCFECERKRQQTSNAKSYHNKYYKKNHKQLRKTQNTYSRVYRKLFPGKINALTAKRRAAKLHATPIWSELELIKQFYVSCPDGYMVDHIVPLQHPKVCGLHVLSNLQYLTNNENGKKSNKFLIPS